MYVFGCAVITARKLQGKGRVSLGWIRSAGTVETGGLNLNQERLEFITDIAGETRFLDDILYLCVCNGRGRQQSDPTFALVHFARFSNR